MIKAKESSLFTILEAFETILDHKHDYIRCRFYNRRHNFSLYVRQDIRVYLYQIFSFSHKDKSNQVIDGYAAVKEIQRHPVNNRIIHIDFYLIEQPMPESIRIKLPIKYENLEKCTTIKLGGRLNITSRELEVKILKDIKSLTPYATVDVSVFKDNENITLKDIKLPEGIIPIKQKLCVATVKPSKGGEG